MAIISTIHTIHPDCGLDEIISKIQPPLPPPASSGQVPEFLRPTSHQIAKIGGRPEMLWISSVPSSAMRDNMIRTYGQWDQDDLCCDLLGGLYEGFDDVQRRGMIVWSDPWLPDSWEITTGFARKWAFLLHGCDDLLAATDRWRARRGEEPLTVALEEGD